MNTNTAFFTLRAGSNNPGTAPSPTTRRATRWSSRSCSTLTQSKVLERADLQAAIKTSWDSFAAELGYDELFLVGSEVVPTSRAWIGLIFSGWAGTDAGLTANLIN